MTDADLCCCGHPRSLHMPNWRGERTGACIAPRPVWRRGSARPSHCRCMVFRRAPTPTSAPTHRPLDTPNPQEAA